MSDRSGSCRFYNVSRAAVVTPAKVLPPGGVVFGPSARAQRFCYRPHAGHTAT